MDKNILQKVEQLNKRRKATKRWQRVVAGLAAVVLIVTNGALSLPAETTENQTYCGIEAHEHTDECHETSAALICGKEESDGHTHSVSCYSAMLCGQEVSEGHTHGTDCYGEKTLSCGKEETAGHAHDGSCNGEATLACGQDGVEGHTHDDSCYTTPIVCGQEVSEGHAHTDACYTAPLTCQEEVSEGHAHTLECCDAASLSCGTEESEEHHHDENCSGEETTTLACDKEVHTHELICFSNPSADVETAASWESAFAGLTLNGNWSQDLVTVAKTQLGYKESDNNYEVEDDGITTRGYTRYGAWAGDAYMDWSAAFVAFCLHYAEVEGVPAYTGQTASQWRQVMQAAGMTRIGDTQVGDLVFLDDDADGVTDHVGIVTSAEGSLTIILGNDQNSVRYRSNPSVVAVIALPENPNAPVETTAPAEETTSPAEDDATDPTEESTPEDGATDPTEESTPEDDATDPTEESTPEDDATDPTEESTPEDDATDPTEESTPEDDATDPTEESTPEDDATDPTEESTPEDDATDPTEESTPEDDATDPTEESTPEDDATDPTEESTPEDDATDPTEESTPEDPDSGVGPISDLITGNCGAVGNEANVTYELDLENNTLTISGSGAMANYSYNSPAPWNDYAADITTVVIDDGVSSVGVFAFIGCSNIENVSLPDSLKRIDDYAFFNCDGLQSITLPDSVTYIGQQAFTDCDNLKTVKLPNQLESLGVYAFQNCHSLAEVTIPGSLNTISVDVFSLCENLTSVTISEGVTTIDSGAFRDCTNLTSISLPSTLTTIQSGAFANCTSLAKITGNCGAVGNEANVTYELDLISGELAISGKGAMADYYSNGAPWYGYYREITKLVFAPDSKITRIGNYAFQGCTALTSIDIPASVKSIGHSTFSKCSTLQTVTFEEASVLESIGNYAFQGCTVLTSIDIPASVKSIGNTSFSGCSALQTVTIESESVLESIGNAAFYSCSQLKGIFIPKSVKSIGYSAFNGCSNLQVVAFEENSELGNIDGYVFRNCDVLKSIDIPANVNSINEYAFYGCDNLRTVTFSKGSKLESIGQHAFYTCTALTGISIPKGVKFIGQCAFYGCSNLQTVAFEDGNELTSLEAGAFENCSSLTSIDLPDTLRTLGTSVLDGCKALTSIEIPRDVTSILNNTFHNCTSLEEIVLNANGLASVNATAFNNCTALDTMVVSDTIDTLFSNPLNAFPGTTLKFRGPNYFTLDKDMSSATLSKPLATLTAGNYYADESGVLYKLDSENMTATLIYCPAGVEEYTIPATIPAEDGTGVYTLATIQSRSFLHAKDLTSVTFPDAAITVETLAFSGSGLMTANGVNTLSELKEIVSSMIFETGAFYQTGIIDGEEITDNITVAGTGLKVSVITTPDEDGDYEYYTGEEVTTTVEIENTIQDNVLRVYVSFDADDPYSSINQDEGDFTYENHSYSVFETDIENTYCLEFHLVPGETFSFSFTSTYANGSSDGGDARIYAVAMTPAEAQELGHKAVIPEKYNLLTWGIQKDDFDLIWLKDDTSNNKILTFQGDNTVDPIRMCPSEDVTYKFQFHPVDADKVLNDGNNNVEYVDFQAVLTLPEGLTWRPDLADDIRKGNVTIFNWNTNRVYIRNGRGTNCFYLENSPTNGTMVDAKTTSIEIVTTEDGTEQILINWRYANPTPETAEILSTTFTAFFNRDQCVQVKDGHMVNYNDVFEIPLDITADVNYYLTNDVSQLTADGVRKISAGDFSFGYAVNLPKVADKLHAGEAYPVTLQITNNSAAISYLQEFSPTYQLPDYYYMNSEDLAAAFLAENSDNLTITIAGANLCKNGTASVIGTDGNPHTVSSSLMGQNVPYLDPKYHTAGPCESHQTVTITLHKDADNNITITNKASGASETVSADAASIQAVLDSWGFTVGYQTVYTLNWNFGHFGFAGKETISLSMPTHAKDTFMRLSQDLRWFAADSGSDYFSEFPFNGDTNGLLNIQAYRSNEAGEYVNSEGTKVEKDNAQKYKVVNGKSAFATVWRDFVLFQDAFKRVVDSENNVSYQVAENVTDGDILKFDINVIHRGDATYEALPLITHLTGPHFPLVSKAQNPALANLGLQEATVDGVEYYILNQSAEKVFIGGAWADKVVVSGNDVMIYWYLAGNNAVTTHEFLTAVKPSADDLTMGFTVGIYEWLNNHQTHRLWDKGLIPGHIPHPEKEVVTNFGNLSDPEDDVVTELYHVAEGESVTYRLSLLCDVGTDVIVQGKTLWDVLPLTVKGATWSDDNISIRYAGPGQVRISEGSSEGKPTDSPWTNAADWVSGSEWEVTEWVDPEVAEDSQVHQRLNWDDDFQIKFQGKTYIYVTLQFPEDIEGGSQLWTELVSIHGTTRLENIFHQYSFEDTAYLDLSFGTEVAIQKGVVESGVQLNAQYSFNTNYNRDDGLFYYSNPGVTDTYVTYYASIYNDGPGRLYVESIQDVLPKGFSIVGMADAVKLSNAVLAPAVSGADSSVKSYSITNIVTYSTEENVTSNDETRITFNLEGDQRTMASLGFIYDATLQRYYILPGTHVYFGYNCKVGEYADTVDTATNRLAVSFYDYSDGGISVADDIKIGRSSDKKGTKPNDGPLENGTDPDCWVTTGQDLSGEGFDTSGESNDVWVTTNVTVKRDKIAPGLQKSVAMLTTLNNNKYTDSTVASGSDVITWRVTSVNNSKVPINGYTLTDVMANPYTFADESKYAGTLSGIGDVTYTVYASQTATTGTAYKLFTIKSRSAADDGTVALTLDQPASTTDAKVSVGGEPVKVLYASNMYVMVSFSKDEAGNEIMSIEFPANHTEGSTVYRCPAIPANGRSELLVNTFNVTGKYKNTQYINQCYLTPVQDFDGSKVEPGRYIEEMDAVYSFAPITVSSGYATSSSKTVTEVDNESNSAADNEAVNYIRIDSEGSRFRYDLIVNGPQTKSMDQLVFIDNLPQNDDHSIFSTTVSRGSEFQVDLDDAYAIDIIVTAKDGTEAKLDPSEYAISFSTSSGPFSDEDWAGTTAWSESSTDARSIRVVINNDAEGSLMPAGCTVTVSFTAKVHLATGETIADLYGKIAWNSFGYSYRIGDSVLQSAPLNVGVRFRSAPTLEKQLLDSKGNPYAATEAETFRFLIYAGEALNLTGETDAAIAAGLDGTAYTIAEITIPAGSSSEDISLGGLKQYSFNDGWVATDVDWTWTNGSSYTFMELPISSDSQYVFTSIGGSSANSYTLTYDGSTSQTISAVNSRNTWALQVNKLSTADTPLAGAWFGLYSPNSDNALPKDQVKNCGLEPTPALTYTVKDETTGEETTYYLMAISESNADGIIRWSDLQEDLYYVRELQAPAGYHLSGDAVKVTREYEGTFPAQRTIKVYNDFGYVLPEAGGEGTYLYTLGGMLMMTAALLWYSKISRRKEDFEAS